MKLLRNGPTSTTQRNDLGDALQRTAENDFVWKSRAYETQRLRHWESKLDLYCTHSGIFRHISKPQAQSNN